MFVPVILGVVLQFEMIKSNSFQLAYISFIV